MCSLIKRHHILGTIFLRLLIDAKVLVPIYSTTTTSEVIAFHFSFDNWEGFFKYLNLNNLNNMKKDRLCLGQFVFLHCRRSRAGLSHFFVFKLISQAVA